MLDDVGRDAIAIIGLLFGIVGVIVTVAAWSLAVNRSV